MTSNSESSSNVISVNKDHTLGYERVNKSKRECPALAEKYEARVFKAPTSVCSVQQNSTTGLCRGQTVGSIDQNHTIFYSANKSPCAATVVATPAPAVAKGRKE